MEPNKTFTYPLLSAMARIGLSMVLAMAMSLPAAVLGGPAAFADDASGSGTPDGTAPAASASADSASSEASAGRTVSLGLGAAHHPQHPQRTALVSVASKGTDGSIFAGGTGSAADPFQIATVEQLQAFRDAVNGGSSFSGQVIRLTSEDYNVAGAQWVPIGNGTRNGSSFTGASFQGIFDGNGARIDGLTLSGDQAVDDPVGLFGIVAGGTVEDLSLEHVAIELPVNECAGSAVGMLAEGGLVSAVRSQGSVTAVRGNGGIVGRLVLNGTIEGCQNDAEVSATGGANVGGIVGCAYYTAPGKLMRVEGCSNSAPVTGTGDVGGIVGLCAAVVQDCTNEAEGTVTGNGAAVGGIVAEQQNYGLVSSCTNHASVTNERATGFGTGGIVGWLRYDGQVADYGRYGMISVTGNHNSGAVTGGDDAGGIVGCAYNAGVVSGNVNTASDLKAHSFAAGIVGSFQDTATPIGDVPKDDLTVSDNVSTTPVASIAAANISQYAYDNPGTAIIEGNTDELPADQPEEPAKPAGPDTPDAGTEGDGSKPAPGASSDASSTQTPSSGSASSGSEGAASSDSSPAAPQGNAADGQPDQGSSKAAQPASPSAESASASSAPDDGSSPSEGTTTDQAQAANASEEAAQAAAGREAADQVEGALAAESTAVHAPTLPWWLPMLLALGLGGAIVGLIVAVRRFRSTRPGKPEGAEPDASPKSQGR